VTAVQPRKPGACRGEGGAVALVWARKSPERAAPLGGSVNVVTGAGFEPVTYTSTLQVMVRRDRGPSGAA
jgi:hypothetical protein